MGKPLRTSGINEPRPTKIKAVTTKAVTGAMIDDIPVGTKFTVSYIHKDWSSSHGLSISQIWNNEYELI